MSIGLAAKKSSAIGCLVALLLSGCGASLPKLLSDQIAGPPGFSNRARTNTGLAILMMGVEAKRCQRSAITIGIKVGDRYKPVRIIEGRDQGGGPPVLLQVAIKPGAYHIIAWSCDTGRYRQSIGLPKKHLFSPKHFPFVMDPVFSKSYASFVIAAGEIVNLGYLRLRETGGTGLMRFDVGDLPASDHLRLRQQRPKIYLRMITRLMRI